MKRAVLIVSNMDDDLHAAAVASELRKRDEHVLCVDPKELMDGKIVFSVQNRAYFHANASGLEFSLNEIKSVLYRRPSVLPEKNEIHPDYRSIVKDEWSAVINGLWELLDGAGAVWVSHPGNIHRSEAKFRQLDVANRLGLRIPRTLITNSKDELIRFFRNSRSKIVMKKLRSHCISINGHNALFVTRMIEDINELDENELAIAPLIFQEYAPKAFDVRLVLVGASDFAIKIHSQAESETQIDYRAGLEKTQGLTHERYSAPNSVIFACQRMLREFGLRFGAFDFALSEDGEHTFLELNPNGQWLWLQLATNARITDAFCDLLSQEQLRARSAEN